MSRNQIQDVVSQTLQEYFETLDGQKPTNLYHMMIQTVEKPLLECVLEYARHNQTTAAEMLGINRNTLRKKLLEHGLI